MRPEISTYRRMAFHIFEMWCVVLLVLPSCFHATADELTRTATVRPLVIAHRGSGRFPDESRRAYEQAAADHADYLECDVQVTKDDVLICFHDPHLTALNSNAPQLWPAKNTTHVPDETTEGGGKSLNGWYIVDFTWDELKAVRMKQSRPERDQQWNDEPLVPLAEFLAIVTKAKSGPYIEAKHSAFYRRHAKKDVADLIIKQFSNASFEFPVIYQSIVIDDIRQFLKDDQMGGKPPHTVLLCKPMEGHILGYAMSLDSVSQKYKNTPLSVELLRGIKGLYGLGMRKDILQTAAYVATLVKREGLKLHVWTFRNEPVFVNPDGSIERNIGIEFGQDPYLELHQFVRLLRVDGVFTDYPATLIQFVQWSNKEFQFPTQQPDDGKCTNVERTTQVSRSLKFHDKSTTPLALSAIPVAFAAMS